MKKQLIITVLFCMLVGSGWARFGIGAAGGIIYPGFSKSDIFESQFGVGYGYEFFIRHQLLKVSDNFILDARYSYKNYRADINLANSFTSRFNFTYLTIGITADYYHFSDFALYAGGGVGLVTAHATRAYVQDVTETLMMPDVSAGIDWNLSTNYNLFSQLDFQFGVINSGDDNIYLHGFRIIVGGTMFLTE